MSRGIVSSVRAALAVLATRPDAKYINPSAIRKQWAELLLEKVDPAAQYTLDLLGDGRIDYKCFCDKHGLAVAREMRWLQSAPDSEITFWFWMYATENL